MSAKSVVQLYPGPRAIDVGVLVNAPRFVRPPRLRLRVAAGPVQRPAMCDVVCSTFHGPGGEAAQETFSDRDMKPRGGRQRIPVSLR